MHCCHFLAYLSTHSVVPHVLNQLCPPLHNGFDLLPLCGRSWGCNELEVLGLHERRCFRGGRAGWGLMGRRWSCLGSRRWPRHASGGKIGCMRDLVAWQVVWLQAFARDAHLGHIESWQVSLIWVRKHLDRSYQPTLSKDPSQSVLFAHFFIALGMHRQNVLMSGCKPGLALHQSLSSSL